MTDGGLFTPLIYPKNLNFDKPDASYREAISYFTHFRRLPAEELDIVSSSRHDSKFDTQPSPIKLDGQQGV